MTTATTFRNGASHARISVVVPTYNRGEFIGLALDSLATQTCPPDEVIVVDDCSTDDTAERVNVHALGPRIQYRRQDRNQGASVARNTGVDLSRGEIIVFLDSDDLLEPEHHATATAVLKGHPEVDLFCCDSRTVDREGRPLGLLTWTEVQASIRQASIRTGVRTLEEIFLFSTPFPGMTVRREAYLRVGGLAQDIFPLDDYDFQLRVAASGRGVYYEHRPLGRYRMHGGNMSGAHHGVQVGNQKLRTIERALERSPSLRPLGRRRRGEVRRELALSLLQAGQRAAGTARLARSLLEDPRGLGELARIARRRVGRAFRR